MKTFKNRHGNFGKHHTKETKNKIHLKKKGKPRSGNPENWKHSEKTKEKLRKKRLGKPRPGNPKNWKGWKHTNKAKKKISQNNPRYWLDKKIPENVKEKMRKNSKGQIAWNKGLKGYQAGEKHPHWIFDRNLLKYPDEFNNELKEQIRKRDSYRCQECFRHQDELYSKNGQKYKLHIHHIDYDKKNNNPNNLISLCRSCHTQTNFKTKQWIDYYKNKVKYE